jgi:hypothetical protein
VASEIIFHWSSRSAYGLRQQGHCGRIGGKLPGESRLIGVEKANTHDRRRLEYGPDGATLVPFLDAVDKSAREACPLGEFPGGDAPFDPGAADELTEQRCGISTVAGIGSDRGLGHGIFAPLIIHDMDK